MEPANNNDWMTLDARLNIFKRLMSKFEREVPCDSIMAMDRLSKMVSVLEQEAFLYATNKRDYFWRIYNIMNSNSWGTATSLESRLQYVKRVIMPKLQSIYFPGNPGTEGMERLAKVASVMEDEIFRHSTDSDDYVRKIYSKLQLLEAAMPLVSKALAGQAGTAHLAAPAPGVQARLCYPAGFIRSVDPGAEMLTPNQQNLRNYGVHLPAGSAVSGHPGTAAGTTESTPESSVDSS